MRVAGIFDRKNPRERFATLVQPHISAMYRMAWRWTQNREESEDLVQDVLVHLVGKLDDMEKIEALRPWLFRVLYRRFVDLYRRERRSPIERAHPWQADTGLLDEMVGSGRNDIDQLEWQQVLLQALETLDDDQRDAVLMHDVEGHTALEIAEILDISVGTVKSRVHRGRKKLREFIEREPSSALERVNGQREKIT